jgi:hypothetical protein
LVAVLAGSGLDFREVGDAVPVAVRVTTIPFFDTDLIQLAWQDSIATTAVAIARVYTVAEQVVSARRVHLLVPLLAGTGAIAGIRVGTVGVGRVAARSTG